MHHHVEAPYVDEGPLAEPEYLVLDIGGDVGALILYADESALGAEIDITPLGEPQSHLIHSKVRRRRAVDREFVACVFPELAAGTYTLWGLDGETLDEVVIEGGRVSEVHGGACRLGPFRSPHLARHSSPVTPTGG
jgi:hypothetical protein